MKTIENKLFKTKVVIMLQEVSTGSLKEITVKEEVRMLSLIRSQLNQAPEGGYKDLSILRSKLRVLDIIEDNLEENTIEVEDADFEVIVKAGEDFIPNIANRGLLEFKEYVEELRKISKEDKPKKKK